MSKSLIPKDAAELVRQSGALVKRGLELASLTKTQEAFIPEEDCLRLTQRKRTLTRSIGPLPKEFEQGKTANPHDVNSFDVNRWLTEVYDSIQLNNGLTLDYVYAFDAHGGEPFLYARLKSAPPFETVEDLFAAFSIVRPEMLLGDEPTATLCKPFATALSFSPTSKGFFQFALFCMSARRFYLYWHSNYNDRKYILTREAIHFCIENRIGDITTEEQNLLRTIDPRPRVRIQGTRADVSLLCFETNLGYSRLRVFLRWPNAFERFEDERIIKPHSALLY
jgi:hypothetical protein